MRVRVEGCCLVEPKILEIMNSNNKQCKICLTQLMDPCIRRGQKRIFIFNKYRFFWVIDYFELKCLLATRSFKSPKWIKSWQFAIDKKLVFKKWIFLNKISHVEININKYLCHLWTYKYIKNIIFRPKTKKYV